MRSTPGTRARILERTEMLRPFAAAGVAHHERLDGTDRAGRGTRRRGRALLRDCDAPRQIEPKSVARAAQRPRRNRELGRT